MKNILKAKTTDRSYVTLFANFNILHLSGRSISPSESMAIVMRVSDTFERIQSADISVVQWVLKPGRIPYIRRLRPLRTSQTSQLTISW